jgi:pyruvate/2-oxoglutarate dehydrogenase complex dihydrolipoamide acyltransferase (E2) component
MKTKLPTQKMKLGSPFRKVALGIWWNLGDPSTYGLFEFDLTEGLKYLAKLQSQTSTKLTISHLFGRAIAEVLKKRPEINGIIRNMSLYQRESIDLFFQVNMPGKHDAVGGSELNGVNVRSCENKSLIQIAEALTSRASHIRGGGEGETSRSIRILNMLPSFVMRLFLRVASFLNYDLNFNVAWAGFPKDAFGSVMITNVGALGLDCAWAPLVPFTRVPVMVSLGKMENRAWVVEDRVEIRPILRMAVTFDHRFMDGSHSAAMLKHIREILAEPEKHLS